MYITQLQGNVGEALAEKASISMALERLNWIELMALLSFNRYGYRIWQRRIVGAKNALASTVSRFKQPPENADPFNTTP